MILSPRKSASSLSLIPEEDQRISLHDTKSCESIYSNASSSKASAQIIYNSSATRIAKRGASVGIGRQASLIPASSEVRKRVVSARRLRVKTFQNQLADAQQTIADLAHENRMLRTLHKRQDSALSKYESTNAELPQLLHSHAEEIRMWQTKYRNLQITFKEQEKKLKQKEAIILSLADQNKYYNQLNKDKNLESRQKLTEKVQALQIQLQEKDNEINLCMRKSQLEIKNLKQQIQNEHKQQRETLLMLERTRLELSGLRKIEGLNLLDDNVKRPNLKEDRKLEKSLDYDKSELSNTSSNTSIDKLLSNHPFGAKALQNYIGPTKLPLPNIGVKPNKPKSNESKKKTETQARQPINTGNLKDTKKIPPKHQEANDQKEKNVPANKKLDTEINLDLIEPNIDFDEPTSTNEDRTLSEYVQMNGYTSDDMVLTKYGDDLLNDFENDDTDENDELDTAKNAANFNESYSELRKMIYMSNPNKESFLDSLCDKATRAMNSPKHDTLEKVPGIAGNRKNKLLAALKAIDEKRNED